MDNFDASAPSPSSSRPSRPTDATLASLDAERTASSTTSSGGTPAARPRSAYSKGETPTPPRIWVEPPIGARRYHTVRVQGDYSDDTAIAKLMTTAEALIARPVFAMHLDLTGVTGSDSKLLSALVLLIRRARTVRVGVTIGLPETIVTMAVVYRVSELLRPHLVPPTV